MTTPTSGSAGEIETLRQLAETTARVIQINLEGVTQAESLVQPAPAGNCLNWILGHLVCMNENMLDLLGQPRVVPADTLQRYDRGSPPIRDAADARELSELMRVWRESSKRAEAGLTTLRVEKLREAAPFSPSGNPAETVGSLLTTLAFHQAYHAGQTGVLRRIAGKDGAIK